MIKRPINFALGVTCGIFLIADIIMNANAFVTITVLIATIAGLTSAFME